MPGNSGNSRSNSLVSSLPYQLSVSRRTMNRLGSTPELSGSHGSSLVQSMIRVSSFVVTGGRNLRSIWMYPSPEMVSRRSATTALSERRTGGRRR